MPRKYLGMYFSVNDSKIKNLSWEFSVKIHFLFYGINTFFDGSQHITLFKTCGKHIKSHTKNIFLEDMISSKNLIKILMSFVYYIQYALYVRTLSSL